jgi:hypothetical protein
VKPALTIVPAEIAPAVVVVLPLVQWTPSAVEQARTLWVARQLLASSLANFISPQHKMNVNMNVDHEAKALGFRDARWVAVAVAAQAEDGQCCALDLAPMSREELVAFGALDAPSVDAFLVAFSAKVASRRDMARPAVWRG